MSSLFRRALCPALCITLAGCASSAGAPSPSNNTAIAPRRSDRSIISADEIAANHETNLYDLVRSLRVEWLTSRGSAASNPGTMSTSGRTRGGASSGAATGYQGMPLQVYMNNQKVGTVDALKDMSPVGIASLKYYGPTEAQAMFGTDNASGAIQVIPVSGGAKPE